MKWSRIFTFTSLVAAAAGQSLQESALDTVANVFTREDDEFSEVAQNLEMFKRDSTGTVQVTAQLIQSVYNSGLIAKTLAQVAASNSTLDTISELVISGINTSVGLYNASGGGLKGLKSLFAELPLNSTDLLNSLMSSGLINSTAEGLLFNSTNRDALADYLGGQLTTHYWVPELLSGLASGKSLTWNYLAETIKTSTSKANQQKTVVNFKRADTPTAANNYSGSALQFFQNLITTVLESSTFSTTVSTSLTALNQSGIVVPLVMSTLKDSSLGTIVNYIAPKVFESGVLYQVDLSGMYNYAKKTNLLSDSTQLLLTNEKFEPPLALIFKRMEANGVYKKIQENMFGSS